MTRPEKPLEPAPKLVLGSSSAYRRQLLERLGVPFIVDAPAIDETPGADEKPRTLALRLARTKARHVAERHPEAIVIGSDQVADLGGRPLGKPGGFDKAKAQLRRMSGQVVNFYTALAVIRRTTGFEENVVARAKVRFRTLTDGEIQRYLHIEEPYDCAGSAKSEGLGIALLESIESDDPTTLIGLPLIRTAHLLRAAGLALP
jgi:septum formation protein